jgi:hypothetical protein
MIPDVKINIQAPSPSGRGWVGDFETVVNGKPVKRRYGGEGGWDEMAEATLAIYGELFPDKLGAVEEPPTPPPALVVPDPSPAPPSVSLTYAMGRSERARARALVSPAEWAEKQKRDPNG